MRRPRFFDLDERYQRLSENGDPLVKLAALIDFEAFRPKLVTVLKRSDGSKGSPPPYDPVLMFKVLVLQTLYTLSDDATEFQIRDRLSFMRFLGLGFEDAVPDAKTVWLFRDHLTRAGAIEVLFAAFDTWLKGKNYLAMSGQIVDASIIAAPRQRNTDAEKAALKEGRIPEAWAAKPKKLAQKDRDALWTLRRAKARAVKTDGSKARVKIAVLVFGYKTHVSIDRKHGFVRRFTVTNAAHDGAQIGQCPRPGQHSQRGLGRHRLPLESQRGLSRQRRPALAHPLPAPGRPRPDGPAAQGQPRPLQSPLGGRDRVCRPKAPLRIVRAYYRSGSRLYEDRARQPYLQPEAVITHARDGGVQAPTVVRMVPKGLRPVRRAVSTTVRMSASPSAAHMAR